MNSQNEQKKMLIQSMKKLVNHVSNNSKRQKEIFDALSLQDLNKIILNLKDDNEYLRRISALLLCELFYMNSFTKSGAVKLLDIQPTWGRVTLQGCRSVSEAFPNRYINILQPQKVKLLQVRMSRFDANCYTRMYSSTQAEDDKICWIINLERKSLKLETLQYKKYSSFTFIDPLKNLFGFSIPNPNAKTNLQKIYFAEQRKQTQKQSNLSHLIDPIHQKTAPQSQQQLSQQNSQFYKSYMQTRNKQKQSKRNSFTINYVNINQSIKTGNQLNNQIINTRPITSRVNANPYSSKREDLNTSLQISKPNSIQTISQYARNSYGGHNNTNISNKMNSSYHQATENTSRNNESYFYNNYAGEKLFRGKEIQTDRKLDYSIKQGRNSMDGNKASLNDHQKFYKRVKQILRK